jgi:hypothetical protein
MLVSIPRVGEEQSDMIMTILMAKSVEDEVTD